MSDQLTLSAETRERAGKGASRALRRSGRVPAVVYGNNEAPLSVHLEERALVKALNTGHFMNSVVMIEADGAQHRTLPKDVQFHPVTDRPLHVDFLRVARDAKVTVAVPIRFEDEEKSPGLKRGGVLNAVRHELELVCAVDNLPDEVVISLAGLEIGDALHISAVTLPEGAEPAITDRDFTVATIVAPSAMKAEPTDEAPADEVPAEQGGEDEAEEPAED